ncbi:MAG: glycosyltransferase family 87 protein [Novosphingobium sp.]
MRRVTDFFQQAGWLDRTRARGYLVVFALVNLAALGFLIATSHGGVDRNGFLLGTDFLSFWTAGQMLHAHPPANVYDAAAHIAAQRAFFAPKDAYTAFFYPPPFLLFCWTLGFLGYFAALAGWLVATGGVFLLAVRLWLRRTGMAPPPIVLFAAFPPVLIAITHGQTALLVAALLGLGALLVRDRPWVAGALFGLAVIKPQFGLLVPIVLLLTREWRVLTGAVLTAALLGLIATVAFGPQVWRDWLSASNAAQLAMDDGAVGYAKMQSVFAAARLFGAPSEVAFALQGGLTLAVTGAVAWASHGRRYDLPLAALMLAGALLVTPFVLDYDMVLLGFPLIWLAVQGFRPWEKTIFTAAFVAPAFARPLALAVGVPIMPAILVALFMVLLRRVVETPRMAGSPAVSA